jgi:hypothetical protein
MIYFLIFYCVFSFIFVLGFFIERYEPYLDKSSLLIGIILLILAPLSFPFILGFKFGGIG